MPHAEQNPNILNSINKVIVVVLLLIVIAVSATYLSFRFTDYFKEPAPQEAPAEKIQEGEKGEILNQLESSNSSLDEKERHAAITSLSSTTTVSASDRNAAMDSLR